MKKYIIFITAITLICLCSCGAPKAESNATGEKTEKTDVTVTMPTDDTVNGYKTTSEVANKTTSRISKADGYYYANTNTKKFHKSTCSSASKIKTSNLYITDDRNELISDGYDPCAICNP